MTQRIVIEGDTVKILEETLLSTAPLASLMPHLERRMPVAIGPLPAGIRFLTYDKDQGNVSLLIERPPSVTEIRVHYKSDNGAPDDTAAARDGLDRASFTIALPYMAWVFGARIQDGNRISIHSASHWFSPKHIENLTDPLYASTLPNVFSGGNICWGGTATDEGQGLDRLATLCNEFLATDFNDHLDGRYPPAYSSLTEWEEASVDDPLVWSTWDWANWNDSISTPGSALDGSLSPASYNFDFIIPAPPVNFTLARFREWIRAIPERHRDVMLAAAVAEGGRK